MPAKELDKIQEIVDRISAEISSYEYLASGGFKSVYKVVINGTDYALKIVQLPNDDEQASSIESRLKREVKIIVETADSGLVKSGTVELQKIEIEDETYLVYSEEFLPGKTIFDLILEENYGSVEEICSLALSLFGVIEELWSKKIIHRDIKPQNIVATGNADRPFVLLDPGLAYITNDVNYTAESAIMPGTLHYLAPEMMKAHFRDSLDFRADLYTIGLSLYEYATGQHPFRVRADGIGDTLSRILNETPLKITEFRSDIPADTAKTINDLLKKRPSLRPANFALLKRKFGGQ